MFMTMLGRVEGSRILKGWQGGNTHPDVHDDVGQGGGVAHLEGVVERGLLCLADALVGRLAVAAFKRPMVLLFLTDPFAKLCNITQQNCNITL